MLFGLKKSPEESEIIILSIPWSANASEPTETDNHLDNLIEVSGLMDFYQNDFPNLRDFGLSLIPCKEFIAPLNVLAKGLSSQLKEIVEAGELDINQENVSDLKKRLDKLNNSVFNYVYNETKSWVDKGKLVAILGGDHSVSLGYMSMVANQCNQFGVLQIDAHCDLRPSYLENDFSHASVMYHASLLPSVSRIVQVGVRDYDEEELAYIKQSKGKIKTFFDEDIKEQLFQGKTWQSICKKIVNALPDRVYITFDIDGLTPELCPNTGTPVPGGLEFEHIVYLLKTLHQSGKQIIGFDLVEVGKDSEKKWDEKVASRILYLLSGYYSISNYKD
jgi:agmatinase